MPWVLALLPELPEIGAAGAAAWAWMTSSTGVAVIGGATTGVVAGVAANEIAKSRAQEKLKDVTIADVCLKCAAACQALACGAGGKYKGGAHWCMSAEVGDGKDSHHTPAKSASYLPEAMGPAIQMDPADHRRTASWGNSFSARAYQAEQRALVASGNFPVATAMDVADIKAKFGDKYNSALTQMGAYTACLKASGVII